MLELLVVFGLASIGVFFTSVAQDSADPGGERRGGDAFGFGNEGDDEGGIGILGVDVARKPKSRGVKIGLPRRRTPEKEDSLVLAALASGADSATGGSQLDDALGAPAAQVMPAPSQSRSLPGDGLFDPGRDPDDADDGLQSADSLHGDGSYDEDQSDRDFADVLRAVVTAAADNESRHDRPAGRRIDDVRPGRAVRPQRPGHGLGPDGSMTGTAPSSAKDWDDRDLDDRDLDDGDLDDGDWDNGDWDNGNWDNGDRTPQRRRGAGYAAQDTATNATSNDRICADDTVTAGPPPVIAEFDPEEDQIMIGYRPGEEGDGRIGIAEDPVDPGTAQVKLGGRVVAIVPGGFGLVRAHHIDLYLIDEAA